uniref:Uncharacterized protein n=1 Tax=Picea sitchensis TaxID=3332 RepID=A0A6B9XY68_PICSI|nr:hypothetical protein Q903MT_gene5582 [Picea sitchensis]
MQNLTLGHEHKNLLYHEHKNLPFNMEHLAIPPYPFHELDINHDLKNLDLAHKDLNLDSGYRKEYFSPLSRAYESTA